MSDTQNPNALATKLNHQMIRTNVWYANVLLPGSACSCCAVIKVLSYPHLQLQISPFLLLDTNCLTRDSFTWKELYQLWPSIRWYRLSGTSASEDWSWMSNVDALALADAVLVVAIGTLG